MSSGDIHGSMHLLPSCIHACATELGHYWTESRHSSFWQVYSLNVMTICMAVLHSSSQTMKGTRIAYSASFNIYNATRAQLCMCHLHVNTPSLMHVRTKIGKLIYFIHTCILTGNFWNALALQRGAMSNVSCSIMCSSFKSSSVEV